jgi:hypothetical protein
MLVSLLVKAPRFHDTVTFLSVRFEVEFFTEPKKQFIDRVSDLLNAAYFSDLRGEYYSDIEVHIQSGRSSAIDGYCGSANLPG